MTEKTIKNFLKALQGKSKPQAYDTTATVTRVEGNTAWVHIPGGVSETPCKLSIDASEGDSVQVRVSGGKAFLTGNNTSPPTDDTTAEKAIVSSLYARDYASAAQASAETAKAAAEAAQESADAAQETADEAAETAQGALTSADGKNTVYYSTSLPSGGDYSDGDLCFLQNSSGVCVGLYVYNGSSWVVKELDAEALSVSSLSAITANLGTVTAGTITGLTINSSTFNATYNGTTTSALNFYNTSGTRIGYLAPAYDSGYGVMLHGSPFAYIEGETYVRITSGNAIWCVVDSVTALGVYENLVGVSVPLTVNSSLSVTGSFAATSAFQTGTVTITPSAADTPTAKAVSWSTMSATPVVTATAVSVCPGTVVTGVSVKSITTTGCVIYVTRTNTTDTVVNYTAVAVN